MSKTTWSISLAKELADLYTATGSDNSRLPEIAKELKITVPAARSKLVSMKVYQKDETVAKVGGASSVRKAHIVRDIAKALGADVEDLESLEKATKATLEALAEAIAESNES